MNWDRLTDEEKRRATHYLDGLNDVINHELDMDELKRYWDNPSEDEQEEILR